MPRRRPTSRIRRSASRSAAMAGGTPSDFAVSNTRRVVSKMPLGALLGPLEAEPVELVGHLDDAAGVHAVVGRIEDAALLEPLLDAGVRELVVRAAAHDRAVSVSTTSSVSAPPSAFGE